MELDKTIEIGFSNLSNFSSVRTKQMMQAIPLNDF